jgi:hypothetical protein
MPLAQLTQAGHKKENRKCQTPGEACILSEQPDFPSSCFPNARKFKPGSLSLKTEKTERKGINRVIIESIHHPVLQSKNAHAQH